MGTRNVSVLVIGLLIAVEFVAAIQWDFEFHPKVPDDFVPEVPIYEKEGSIGPFSYRNYYSLTIPLGMAVSHVRVTVWSLSPPKVDFDEKTKTVSIVYSFIQITISTFKIKVDGIPFVPYLKSKESLSDEHSAEVKSKENI